MQPHMYLSFRACECWHGQQLHTFLLGANEKGYLSVPVRFTAASQNTENVQRVGVKDIDTGVLAVQ